MRRALAAALWLLLVPGASAQWSSTASQGGDAARIDATARNDEGAELRIWVDGDSRLRAAFRPAPGLVQLDPRGCPTFQIDDRTPENLSLERHVCRVDANRSEVFLAEVRDGKVESPTLLELMNGSELRVRYRLTHAGYRATRFSLRGSKQALTAALGEGLSVVGN